MRRLAPPAPQGIDYRNLRMRGSPTPDLKAFANWVATHPQAAMDFVAQGLGTTLGIAGGIFTSPVTGPAGPIAGGATGNVVGKQLSRRVGQALNLPDAEPAPDLLSTETAIDAGLGALGPGANAAGRTIARVVTGLPAARHMGAAKGTGMTPKETGRFVAEETEDALERAMTPNRRLRSAIPSAAAGGMLIEPITGSLIGLGLNEAVTTKFVPYLLGHPRLSEPFARWAMNVGKHSKNEVAASLAAVFAGQALSARDREARDAIQRGLATGRRVAFDPSVERWRGAAGRFVAQTNAPDDDAEQDDAP